LQTDTLQTSINEIEFFVNMSEGSSLEIKGRSEEGWKRLYFADARAPWSWVRIETAVPILQLRFVGELYTADAFVALDDIETFSKHDSDMSWEITSFTILGATVAVLLFLECSRSSPCRGHPRLHGTALHMEESMYEESIPLGLELVTIDGHLEEGKVAEEANSIAF